jgi:hypothetical protein
MRLRDVVESLQGMQANREEKKVVANYHPAMDSYDHAFQFEMPPVVQQMSAVYIEENDNVFKFVTEFVFRDDGAFFTLKSAKEVYRGSEHYAGKIATLKNDLQKLLKVKCEDQRWLGGKLEKNVFFGWRLERGDRGPAYDV